MTTHPPQEQQENKNTPDTEKPCANFHSANEFCQGCGFLKELHHTTPDTEERHNRCAVGQCEVCRSKKHILTPDTEWETQVCKACGGDGFTVEYDPRDQTGNTPMQVQCDYCHAEGEYMTLDEVRSLLSPRDTYWNERVEGMKRKLELEYIEGECVECAGTGEGADNPNSNSGETYPCYLCKGKGRFSGYKKKTVDTLLDNLK